jgi:hypothetical protein
MKEKPRKKSNQSIARIVVEAASNELPLTAFLSLFSDRESSDLAMDARDIPNGNTRRNFRRCS